jgi:two-component system chemotaxis response regulator CheB
MAKKTVRVLIVDDSALVRKILANGMAKDPDIEVVGQASNPYMARDLMVELHPDVITLDVEMPRMDGVTFLKKFMAVMPTPTIIISSLTQQGKQITLDALEAGAVDIIAKPTVGLVDGLPLLVDDINQRIKAAAGVNVAKLKRNTAVVIDAPTALHETTDRLIVMGSSTGGVEALSRIIPAFPSDSAGIVIVQHMPAGFTATFAERLNSSSKMRVKEAEDGDRVMQGLVLLAPGGMLHTTVVRSGGQYRISLQAGDEVNYSRPSVDVLFFSAAKAAGRNVAAAILTGMGRDGAAGLKAIQLAGGKTIAQDEATSIVFGMPQMAISLDAADKIAPLEKIPSLLISAFENG